MSKIEWTEKTWNPVVGCTPVSPGCLNCYAASMALRLEGMGVAGYAPLSVEGERLDANGVPEVEEVRIAERRGAARRAVFTGSVRLVDEALSIPLKRRTPTTWFTCSMGDLFHESVPFDFIDRVWAVMALTPQHTYQVLTKRPERMREYLWGRQAGSKARTHEGGSWPLANVWLGTSAEDQATFDARIGELIECPAVVRFLSLEPLLGPIDASGVFGGEHVVLPGDRTSPNYNAGIDWVIVGGESGLSARLMSPDWARLVRDQCVEAGVAFFFKQWGEWWPVDQWEFEPDRILPDESEWATHPRMFRVDGALMFRVGKKLAGRMLDGRTWDEMPRRAGVTS